MVGNHHLDAATRKLSRPFHQFHLIFPTEASGGIVREMGGIAERDIGRIAINHIAGPDLLHGFLESRMHEFCLGGLQMKVPHLFFGESGFYITAKGRIEYPFGIIPAQSVIAVTVEIYEQGRFSEGIAGFIEFQPQIVKGIFSVVFRDEQSTAIINELPAFSLDLLVEPDQIRIAVGDKIRRVIGVEEYCGRAGKRLHQSLSLGQFMTNEFRQPMLAAGPFQKWF
jgi:hypothetical protein